MPSNQHGAASLSGRYLSGQLSRVIERRWPNKQYIMAICTHHILFHVPDRYDLIIGSVVSMLLVHTLGGVDAGDGRTESG